MPFEPPSKWTAFLMSLAVPGSGQLLARSPTALAWFAVVGALGAVFASPWLAWDRGTAMLVELPLLATVSLLSAWHARGLLEPAVAWRQTSSSRPVVECSGGRGRAIHAKICIASTLSTKSLWQRISALTTFLTIDPFHEKITMMRDRPAQGVDLVLQHNAFGRRFNRFGRILWWREGEGYAISDLSARDQHVGFPHIFEYRVHEISDGTSALCVEIKGRWTSRVFPPPFGRWWIAAVCRYHASLLRKAL